MSKPIPTLSTLKIGPEDPTALDQHLPQRIRVLPENVGELFFNSDDRKSGTPYNFIVSLGGVPSSLRRIRVDYGILRNTIPNINVYNNEIKFQLSSTGTTIYTATLTEGVYKTLASIQTEIQTRMNAPSPILPGGTTFAVVLNTDTKVYTVTCTGNTFNFIDSKMTSQYGENLMRIDKFSATNAVQNIFGASLFYTKYINVSCDELSESNRNKTHATKPQPNTIIIWGLEKPEYQWDGVVFDFGSHAKYLSTEDDKGVKLLTLIITDQFGLSPSAYNTFLYGGDQRLNGDSNIFSFLTYL